MVQAPLIDRREQLCDVPTRLGTEVAFTVDADGHAGGFEVAFAEDERGVDFYRLGVSPIARV